MRGAQAISPPPPCPRRSSAGRGQKMPSVLVTGCSSGIGLDAARHLQARGWTVLATCRAEGDLAARRAEGMVALPLDLADPASVAACAQAALDHGPVDALVNNAAFALPGAVEDLPRAALRAIFEVNLFGTHDLTRRLIPHFRQRGAGRIVNVSSVLGLVGIPWRGAYAATKFLMYTATSGAIILASFFGIVWLSGSSSFDYDSLNPQTLPAAMQLLLLTGILIGFGIKIPLVPFHTWLPDAYVEASTPIAILLGGVLAKLGTYGIIRFGLSLFPEAWATLAPSLAVWGTVSVLYGALAAIAQKDIKRMVAYSSIGHMGYVLLGAAASNSLALVGAVSQMVSHGLILAILFHLVGVVEAKVGTRELDVLNGLMNPIRGLPLISALLVLGGMASAGIPGMTGFIAEFIVFQGSYLVFPLATLLCVVGTGLTAVYFVILLNRTCFGKLDNDLAYYPKVEWAEKIPALVLTALIIFLGVQPTWLVRWSEPTTTAMVVSVPVISRQRLAQNSESTISLTSH